ncbi:hypothetical protein [Hydrogenophaga sp.]|jgi:hypothetical protein|uniref:hypothetical protein n=1 Tax=Hydrogenophaga sp. TaxID=1904254 RepID=UPI00260556F5|nr:hypothetical protein [Hydrogenophaga sp.]
MSTRNTKSKISPFAFLLALGVMAVVVMNADRLHGGMSAAGQAFASDALPSHGAFKLQNPAPARQLRQVAAQPAPTVIHVPLRTYNASARPLAKQGGFDWASDEAVNAMEQSRAQEQAMAKDAAERHAAAMQAQLDEQATR